MERIQRRVTPGISAELTQNPAWFGRAVAENFDLLKLITPRADWLPDLAGLRMTRATGKSYRMSATLPEYGCGAYGCVVPTSDPYVVFKITSDASEAAFIRDVLPTLRPHGGCVQFHQIVSLAGEVQGRPLFGIWRESAHRIGRVSEDADQFLMMAYESSDSAVRITDRAERDSQIRATRAWWHRLTEIPELVPVASTLLGWLNEGVFVGDVHAGNVGWVTRNEAEILVITDPGHAMVL